VAVGAAAVTLVIGLTASTASRADLFRSELRVWQDAAAKSLVNERPHLQYAVLLRQAGRTDEARAAISAAATINPFSSEVDTMSYVLRSRENSR
jgi:Flp pilus assembly protein TadD